jgi:hypothetical protein
MPKTLQPSPTQSPATYDLLRPRPWRVEHVPRYIKQTRVQVPTIVDAAGEVILELPSHDGRLGHKNVHDAAADSLAEQIVDAVNASVR